LVKKSRLNNWANKVVLSARDVAFGNNVDEGALNSLEALGGEGDDWDVLMELWLPIWPMFACVPAASDDLSRGDVDDGCCCVVQIPHISN